MQQLRNQLIILAVRSLSSILCNSGKFNNRTIYPHCSLYVKDLLSNQPGERIIWHLQFQISHHFLQYNDQIYFPVQKK